MSIYKISHKYLPDFFVNFLLIGHERSVNAKMNIIASLFIRGCSILISLVLVPLTIHYVNSTRYGIWLTLSSVIGWFGFFDIGFGNGLRNKFAEAMANGQKELARIYVSTTYAILTIIICIVLIIFLCVNPFLNWSGILNADKEIASELSKLALIVFSFFCIQFILQIITTVLIADQKPAKSAFFNLLGNIFSLIIIFILTKTTQGSLLLLGFALSSTPFFVLLSSSLWFYNNEYKDVSPSFKFVKISYAKDLMKIGVKFFIIQIAAIVIYQTTNIIISQICGPKEVTVYNIAFKYFSVLTMVFSIILSPFWSAFTEAKVRQDYTWMKSVLNKLIKMWVGLVCVAFLFLIFSQFFYTIWVGSKVIIPFNVSLVVFTYVLIFNWCAIFSQITAGLGKIKFQLYAAMALCIVNIPLAIFLGKQWGILGIVSSSIILSATSAIWNPIQINLLLNQKAKGIWNE